MKMAKRNVAVNGPRFRGWLVAGAMVLWAPMASRAINAVTTGAGAVNQDVHAAQAGPIARYSPGVADIVKMVEAKVDPEVIKTYVKSSSTAYNPSATEIIALKDHGVAPEILTAMLQRGAEVRAQSMRAAQAAPNAAVPQISPGAVNPYAPAPGYDYSAQPVYPNYPNYTYSYPAYSYDYPSYAYGYPAYGFGYSWPFCSFGFGSYPYGGFCGYPYASYGWRYPYHYGGRGYYGGGSYGRGSYGGRGYYGNGGHAVPYGGFHGGSRSFASGGRAVSFTGSGGGFRGGGGFSGHSASFGGRGGGGFGGHGGGRGR
jgi:hypothetical protein